MQLYCQILIITVICLSKLIHITQILISGNMNCLPVCGNQKENSYSTMSLCVLYSAKAVLIQLRDLYLWKT